MNKLIITNWNGCVLTALISEKEILELGIEEDASILGNIYIGKVNRIIKNLNAAFVDFGKDQTGYYSLADNPSILYADGRPRALKGGDEIIVQVARDAVKTKDPVLTSNLNFAGKFAVVTTGKSVIGFSAKIPDREWRETMRPRLEKLTEGACGLIVRTNAYNHEDELIQEAAGLIAQSQEVIRMARYRAPGTLLYQAEPLYVKSLKGFPAQTLSEIITDDRNAYEAIRAYLQMYQQEDLSILRYYDDPMVSLTKLYALETALKQACQKRVWLKSGGYLVIEPTEAMVVIDVNTGKYSGRKNLDDTIRLINQEAAREICHQIRLRNLSGIIMIDFIDMKEESDRTQLLDILRTQSAYDPVRTTVVDMTPLGLVEMTRKKGRKPLWEQVAAKL